MNYKIIKAAGKKSHYERKTQIRIMSNVASETCIARIQWSKQKTKKPT